MMARTDFLNDSGSVTECVLGSNTGGLRSPSANDSAIGPSASRAISPSISLGGVGIQVGVLALAERLVDAEHLEQVEYLVTDVALVVAHVSSSSRMPLAVGYFWSKLPTSNWPELYRSVTSTQSTSLSNFHWLSNPVVGRDAKTAVDSCLSCVFAPL